MLYVQKIIAALLLPPGIFIVLLLFLSAYLFYYKQRGRYLAAAITAVFYLLSTNLVSGLLMRPLENIHAAQIEQADVILVLGGGASAKGSLLCSEGELGGFSANRLLTAAQLQKRMQIPLLVTGGQVFAVSGNEARISRNILLNLNVPKEMILIEDQARNTEENAANALAICRERGFEKIVLVTSAFHMQRSLLNFENQNIDSYFAFLPYPCDYQSSESEYINVNIFSFVPQQDALTVSYLALHEYLGILAKKLL